MATSGGQLHDPVGSVLRCADVQDPCNVVGSDGNLEIVLTWKSICGVPHSVPTWILGGGESSCSDIDLAELHKSGL